MTGKNDFRVIQNVNCTFNNHKIFNLAEEHKKNIFPFFGSKTCFCTFLFTRKVCIAHNKLTAYNFRFARNLPQYNFRLIKNLF